MFAFLQRLVAMWFASRPVRRNRHRQDSYAAQIQLLEPRALLSGTGAAIASGQASTHLVATIAQPTTIHGTVINNPVLTPAVSPHVLSLPVVATNPLSESVKSGTAFSLTAIATGSPLPKVQWQVSTNGGATFTNIAGATAKTYSKIATAAMNGNEYQAVFTNSQGSVTTSAATLTVGTLPVITTNPTNQSVATGNQATFTAVAIGNPAPTVQWQVSTNGGTTYLNVAGATSTSYTVTTTSNQNGYDYRAIFGNSLGIAISSPAKLTVLYPPTVLTNPVNKGVIAGAAVAFTATAKGNPAPTVQWQVSTNTGATFTNIPGATGTTYSTPTTVAMNGNEYRAVFTNSQGFVTTTAATLIVGKLPVVTTNPTNQTIASGATVTFNAAASATPAPTVQWQVSTNGGTTYTNISGATSISYSFTAAAIENGYLYRAQFTNPLGMIITSAAKLTVLFAPTVLTNPANKSVAVGAAVTFTTTAGGDPVPTVQWQVSTNGGATFISIAGATTTAYTKIATATMNGNEYRAVFTNSQGSVTTTAATLTLLTAPVVTSNPTNQNVAAGTSATFNATAGGNPGPTVQWQVSVNGGATYSNIAGATSTTFIVTGSATNNGDEYRAVFANSIGTAITTGAKLTLLTVPVITLNPVNHTVASGASVSFIATASGNPTPAVKWQVSTNGGAYYTDILGATSTTYTFTASSVLDGNEYRAVFTNMQGTSATTSAGLSVLIAPAITSDPSNQATLTGSGVTFTAAASGNPTPTVQWQVSTNGGSTFTNVAGATSKSYTFNATSTENGYEYRAVFTNSQGTAKTSAAVLTLHGSSLLLHNFGDLGPGGVEYQLAAGPNGTTFFETNDLMTGDVQLWISNGTASGTTMLRDFGDLHNSGRLEVLQELGTSPNVTLVFESMDFLAKDLQVWSSTGTVTGTVLLHNFGDLGPAGDMQTFEGMSNVPNTNALLEVVDSNANDTQLWGTNGTPAGTALLHDFGNLGTTGGLAIQGFANTGSQIISSDDSTSGDTQLWATSGTVPGTIQLHDFGDLGDNTSYLSSITNAQNGTLLFQTDNATTGDNQLWTTTGTFAGTILLHDYGQLSDPSLGSTGELFIVGKPSAGTLLYQVENQISGNIQLWDTDGTVAGTIQIQNLGERGGHTYLLNGLGNAPTGSVVFASLNPTTEITEVWESNGTSAGTLALRTFGDLGATGFVGGLLNTEDGSLVFTTYNSVIGDAQLWVTVGTPASTLMLVDFGDLGSNTLGDLNQGLPAVESLGSETNVYGLVQTYNSFTGDVQLWETNGTVAGTIMLNDFGGESGPNGGPIYDLNVTLSGIEMIQWYDPITGSLQLWVTNGTVPGTIMLHDFFAVGTSAIDFVGLAKNGAALLLINEFDIGLTELYASNGTVAGTKLLNDFIFSTVTPVTDLATGANVPGLFSSYNPYLRETQLWGTDGTPVGTSMLLSSIGVDNSIYFTEDAGTLFAMAILSSDTDSELWSITP